MSVQVLTFDFPKFLKKITGYKNWKEVQGPDSRCGLDYWYECYDEDGERHTAYINIDQGEMTISDENDERIFTGNCSAAQVKGKK